MDSEIADRHIMFLIRTKRAKYLRQREIREIGEYRDQFYQSVNMQLEMVDASMFPTSMTLGKNILRTIKPLPNIVGREALGHMTVRTLEFTGKEIEVMNKFRMIEAKYAPRGFVFCYREDDGRLYFYSPDPGYLVMENVVVQCILENPEDIVELNDLTVPLDDYPITGEVWEIIREEVLKDLLGSKSIPEDVTNNKADDPTTTAQK